MCDVVNDKPRILITGASGLLGGHICRLAQEDWNVFGMVFNHDVIIPSVTIVKADLTNKKNMCQLIRTIRPDAIIHTAAMSDPNFCQTHREESFQINVEATVHLAQICAERSIPFIFTSTDMVFDGCNAPYHEYDPVSPINVYAEHKVQAEQSISKISNQAAICRIPLMFGFPIHSSNGFFSVMIQTMKIGRPVYLFSDEFRTPLSVEVVASGLLSILNHHISGIIHLGGPERISRFDFGKLTARVAGIKSASLLPCYQKNVSSVAPRPRDVSLDSSKARETIDFEPVSLEKQIQSIFNSGPAR